MRKEYQGSGRGWASQSGKVGGDFASFPFGSSNELRKLRLGSLDFRLRRGLGFAFGFSQGVRISLVLPRNAFVLLFSLVSMEGCLGLELLAVRKGLSKLGPFPVDGVSLGPVGLLFDQGMRSPIDHFESA